MFERQQRKKYGWSDFADMTKTSSEANESNKYIVYKKEGKFVKEFPNGKIIPINISSDLSSDA